MCTYVRRNDAHNERVTASGHARPHPALQGRSTGSHVIQRRPVRLVEEETMDHPLVARIPATFRWPDEVGAPYGRGGKAMRRPRKLALAGTAAGVGLLLLTTGVACCAGRAGHQHRRPAVKSTAVSLNLLWVVIGAVLVIFMQAGFALVETGFCRAKHAAHVVSTNFAIFGLGFVAFFVCGFAFAFSNFSFAAFGLTESVQAPSTSGLIGSGNWVFLWGKAGYFLSGISPGMLPAVAAFFLYMVAFMDTTATIPTGSMAERWKWKSFVVWGLFCGAIYYPLFAGFTWGGGWLAKLVRAPASASATSTLLAPASSTPWVASRRWLVRIVLGPRIGKFGKDGKPRALPGHHIPMAMLGTSSCCSAGSDSTPLSTLAATDVQFATVATNTAIAAAFGATVAMLWIMRRTGKPDPGMMANGMLAGLGGHHCPVRFRRSLGSGPHRGHRRRPRHRGDLHRRAEVQDRRSRRRHLRARCQRHLRRAVHRPVRQRPLGGARPR